jgi:hypothetical protein
MPPEFPLQHNMLTGELDDKRSRRQKALDRKRDQPQQMEMFSQRDLAQFGVRAHPQMSLSPHTRLVLISEDPRTEEEIERDRQLEAERNTRQMFGGHPDLYVQTGERTSGAGEPT